MTQDFKDRNEIALEPKAPSSARRVLLTGASGYVGGRLLPRLEAMGISVRCMARRPEFIQGLVGPQTEVVEGDVLREKTLGPALEGIHTAYYMIHAMASAGDEAFEAQDRLGAENFARAARAADVQRIVYLGGLGDEKSNLSPHLRSRPAPRTDRTDNQGPRHIARARWNLDQIGVVG